MPEVAHQSAKTDQRGERSAPKVMSATIAWVEVIVNGAAIVVLIERDTWISWMSGMSGVLW